MSETTLATVAKYGFILSMFLTTTVLVSHYSGLSEALIQSFA